MFKRDYETGMKGESEVYNIISNCWDDNIKKVENKYNSYDFEGDSFIYELKTRNNKLNSYPSTLFPYDKIEKAKNQNKKLIILFYFTDGLYYITYNDTKFNNFPQKAFRRYDRGSRDILKQYIFIPIEKLKKVE